MTIKYAAERVTVSAAQLAVWSAKAADGVVHLDGPCPVCGHDSPNDVELRDTASAEDIQGSESAPATSALTIALACTCQEEHPGRPGSAATGCGRTWSATETAVNGAITLSPDADPTLVAAAEALRAASATQLTDIKGAAEKWIGGVTALYTLFGLAGVTISRSVISGMVPAWQAVLACVMVLALALAALAIFRIYRAAYGWPVTRPVQNDAELREWWAAQESAGRVRAEYLRGGVKAAACSLAALAVAVGLIWFSPQQVSPASPVQVTLTSGAQVCGTLLPAAGTGTLQIERASDDVAFSVPLRQITEITAVAGC